MSVVFRKLDARDVPSTFITIKIALSHLLHYRIGSIWRNGKRISNSKFQETKIFRINFSESGWSHTSRYFAGQQKLPESFPNTDYPLPRAQNDKCWLLDFKLPGERNVLIPCTEFLVRGYARNSEIPRALTSLPWEDALSVFYEVPKPAESHWLVRPTRLMRDADAIFLAHLLYDKYTAYQAKFINSQLQSSDPNQQVLIKVAPWFQGPAEIEVRGYWINDGNTFLCLDLCGYSSPKGQTIEWQRLKFDTDDGVDGTGRTVMPRPIRTAIADEFVAAADDIDPDHHSETLLVNAAPFNELNPHRRVNKTRRTIKANTGRRGPTPTKSSTHSTGEGIGSGKDTAKLEFISDAVLESQGFLRDIWRALNHIAKSNKDGVTALRWYTPTEGLISSGTPKIIKLPPLDEESTTDSEAKNWCILDKKTGETRGLLVFCITINKCNYFGIEVQHKEDSTSKSPESYAGVVFKSHVGNIDDLGSFIEQICLEIRYKAGRFKKIFRLFPIDTNFIYHRKGTSEVLYRQSLITAFKGLGVTLK
ncbi:hypothetical protein [Pseudomonas sp. EA_65y_Pfl2_P78]|uniref:hypothetical protein n=1 Tax=Pseudomonas sp. EA_65y_Pfl2_P78 TaxID=3088695 RepID=UPI0030DBC89C